MIERMCLPISEMQAETLGEELVPRENSDLALFVVLSEEALFLGGLQREQGLSGSSP